MNPERNSRTQPVIDALLRTTGGEQKNKVAQLEGCENRSIVSILVPPIGVPKSIIAFPVVRRVAATTGYDLLSLRDN
jgi:hypothetical protein